MKNRFLLIFLFPLLFLWLVPQAMAAGTPAGTGITNQAYVDYNDANGNPLTRVFSNIVTTTVSQLAGIEVVPPTESLAGSNETTIYFDVDVENTGNGTDTYDFTYAVTGGTWTPTSVSFYFDDDGNGIYDGTEPLIGSGFGPHSTAAIPADGNYLILMAVTIPEAATAPDTSQTEITVTATSQFEGSVSDFGVYTTTVASAVISAIKSHLPASPAPGDTITYTITLTNTGSSDGTVTIVNDSIPAGLTYVPESITLNAVSQTDAPGDDSADFNDTTSGAVFVNVGTITAGGGSTTITFQATVDAGIGAGTFITNQATVDYLSGGNPISENTNGDTLTVATAPDIAVTPGTTVATGDPGDTITYAITIDNNGNDADVIDVTYTSSEGWTWDLWYDANNDGIAGNDGDFLLTDTDGDGIVDTGSIPQGGSVAILATTTIPAGTVNGTVDTLVVTGTSSVDTGISDTTGNLATTVTAPVLGISKAVSPTGDQPPGTTLTYTVTVTNNGSGVATAVVITDIVPNFTTYVAGSIKIGATPADLLLPAAVKTDAADGDGADFDAGSNAVIAGSAAKTLGSGGTFILEFQVTID